MKSEQFNLSNKIEGCTCDTLGATMIDIKYIKRFIRLLKKEIIGKAGILEEEYVAIIDEIDKLAGNDLISTLSAPEENKQC